MSDQPVNITITGLKSTQRSLKKLPDDFKESVKDASWEISQDLASAMRAAGRTKGRQTALIAPTVATKDALMPFVQIGGSTPVGRHGTAAYKILFGSEFGSHAYKQFKPVNKDGYWIYPTVRREEHSFVTRWLKAADDAIEKFATEGGDD